MGVTVTAVPRGWRGCCGARKGRRSRPSVGRSVHPSQAAGKRLLGSFGLSPVGLAVHLLVGAVACTFPGHPAGHDKRQVPTPGGRGRGSAGPASVAAVSSHISKDPERETWHLIPMGRSGAGPGSPRLQVGPDALREQVIKAACFTQTAAKSIREPGLIQRGKGTRGDGVAFHKKPPSAET